MEPAAVIGIVIIIIIVAVAFIVLSHPFNGTQAAKKSGQGKGPAVSVPQVNITTSVGSYGIVPYISESQAKDYIGNINYSLIKSYNKSSEGPVLNPSLVANTTYLWNVTYSGSNNTGMNEEVAQENNLTDATYVYNQTLLRYARYYPDYTKGFFGSVVYVEMPYNASYMRAYVLVMKSNYVALAYVYNQSVNLTGLVGDIAGDIP